MRIKKLRLYSENLEAQKAFYKDVLEFDLLDTSPTSFTIRVGWTEFTFEQSDQKRVYHFAFLIPANKLSEALDWVEKRVDTLPIESGEKTTRFESWNANAFYFYDADGNVAEFIVRHDLKNESQDLFNSKSVLCVNEIGLPTNDIRALNQALESKYGTAFWKGNFERFGTNGSPEGLFLLPNYTVKTEWFPTTIKLQPESFEIEFESQGNIHGFRFENGLIQE